MTTTTAGVGAERARRVAGVRREECEGAFSLTAAAEILVLLFSR
jgi:hypothetical protein